MKRPHVLALVACVLCWTGPAFGTEPARDTALVRDRYEQIVARLDPGGDLFVVANVEGMLENLVENLVAVTLSLALAVDVWVGVGLPALVFLAKPIR